ncbi:phosphatase PAP2 family protein [Streptomyces sp. BI20]|uniref:phosphatase PAP2 family protein n=1 Tax=Streptomyces sp. BI20 TaxID=3403460 RepID=UPI003C77522B
MAAVGLGFLIALEVIARHYEVPGPITVQAREVIFAPQSGPLLYAAMALTLVVLTWRQRFLAIGAAIGIDLVFWGVRALVGAQMMFGNGALWVTLGLGVFALVRRTGRERALLLKGVGLGLLLVTGRKTGYTWLFITSKTRPEVLDQYIAAADRALGDPGWAMGRLVQAGGPVAAHVLDWVYVQLAVAAVAVALYQLRHVARDRRFPTHHLVRTFLVIGLLGPGIYMIYPVVGPIFAYGADGGQWAVANLWPHTPPPYLNPQHMPFDEFTPRNCMPSLHTAWSTAIFVHSRKGPRLLRFAGAFWLVATLGATLGFGYHYGADIIAGVVFTLTIEAGLRAHDRGWTRAGIRLVVHGTVVFTALLLAYRFLGATMAGLPWVFGPLMVLATASVIAHYTLVTRAWARAEDPGTGTDAGPGAAPGVADVPGPRRTAQPEPV